MLLWIKAFHIIFMVTWFSGLFYLPRLFVYHALCMDSLGDRLPSKLASADRVQGDLSAQTRNVYEIHEDSSTKSTMQSAAEVEFRRRSSERFKMMESRLYYGIATPGGALTTLLGFWLLKQNLTAYMSLGWMHAKLGLVFCLWVYHLYCGKFLNAFKADKNRHSQLFYRYFNEIPVVMLVGIVILVVVKPN